MNNINAIKRNLIWYFKQMFPLKYSSKFTVDGEKKRADWKMWLGKVYDYNIYEA
jgi:hypothetical protein